MRKAIITTTVVPLLWREKLKSRGEWRKFDFEISGHSYQ
jgi:hypothetical protein